MGQHQVFTVELDGKQYDLEGDHAPTEAEARAAIGTQPTPEPQEPTGPTPSLTVGALRTVPAVGRSVARFAAAHPAATQKVIGAGISTAAGGLGATVGGVPGAVVGASIRGVTPAQATIRQVAGQLSGETPEVATQAGRALGVVNFGKETAGLRMKPTDLVSTGDATRAVDNYAESMGQKVVRVLGPDGKVVIGPEAATRIPTAKVPGVVGRTVGRVGQVLAPLQAAVGVTDLAQMAEPNRRDIGVAGVGSSLTPETMGMTPAQFEQYQQQHPALLNALAGRLRAAVLARLRGQAQP